MRIKENKMINIVKAKKNRIQIKFLILNIINIIFKVQ